MQDRVYGSGANVLSMSAVLFDEAEAATKVGELIRAREEQVIV